jgi:hypothetical protein
MKKIGIAKFFEKPIKFTFLQLDGIKVRKPGNGFDAVMEAKIGKRKLEFQVVFKARVSPNQFLNTLQQINSYLSPGEHPLMLVDYVSDEILEMAFEKELSIIDTCGNGLITVPSQIYLYQGGNKNLYPQQSSIKNIYSAKSSLIGRALVEAGEFKSLKDIAKYIEEHDGEVTISTISKILKGMREDLIVSSNGIRLIQKDKLLKKLAELYKQPIIASRRNFKIEDKDGFMKAVSKYRESGFKMRYTGDSSASEYTAYMGGKKKSMYCENTGEFLELAKDTITEDDLFPTFEFVETESPWVYFGMKNSLYSSLTQAWVEMANGDKRQRQMSELIYSKIQDAK